MPSDIAFLEAPDVADKLDAALTNLGVEAAAPETTEAKVDVEQQQPAAEVQKDGKTPDLLSSDTRAAAEPKAEQPATAQKVETQKSEFAKANDRLDKTWKAVNERKAAQEAKETALAAREAELTAKEQKAEQARVKASSKLSPEEFDSWATQTVQRAKEVSLQAKGLLKEADDLENDGKYPDAERKRAEAKNLERQSVLLEGKADEAKLQAEHLRKNPDPTVAQLKEAQAKQLQHYTIEAAKKWPAIGENGSEFQKALVNAENNLRKQGIDVNESPIMRYFCAEYVAANTTAARVPELEKKLGVAEARVKELELLTAPGGGQGSVQGQPTETPFGSLSVEQQQAQLSSVPFDSLGR